MAQERVSVSWLPTALTLRTAAAAPPLPARVTVLVNGNVLPLEDSCTTLPPCTVMYVTDAVPVPSTRYTTVETFGGGESGAGTT